jgi:hypothetical protein
MHRTERALLLGIFVALSNGACGDDKPVRLQKPPGEGVLPAAGKPGTVDELVDDGLAGAAPDGKGGTGGSDPVGAGGDAVADAGEASAPDDDFTIGTELRVEVSADAPSFVSLASASVVDVPDANRSASTDWDLVFQGWDIFTNGGASGGGMGKAFGPLPFTYFVAGTDPTEVPFLIEDKAAGAFRDWYFYDGQWHALYSRFHAYGVKSGDRLFKLQLLGYYGDVQGAPISALYRLRYAEVTPEQSGTVIDVARLDGTAGGLGGSADETSGCLSLLTGEQLQLTPSQTAESSLWDLSFRRDSISINGGLGGPGDVSAVDLAAEQTEAETLDVIKARTAESEADAFAAIDFDTLTQPSLKYRGDRIVSAFTDSWADTALDPPSLADDNTWLVVGADGTSRFLLAITRVEHPTTEAAGAVVIRIQRVR